VSLASGPGLMITAACVVMGATIVIAPAVAWALLGALMGLLLLQLPAYTWASVAVITATLSRLIVATGSVPGIVNFFHFPLAFGAALLAATSRRRGLPVAKPLRTGLAAFFLVSLVSWVLNGGEFLRPLLDWLVFSEPFLIIYALVRNPPSPDQEKFLWKLTLAIAFVQLPLAVWQAVTLGLSDTVQGTFIGMGAGHHVAGGVALTGTLICVSRGLSSTALGGKPTWLLGAILLFVIPVLSDAKQNIIAFLPALVFLLLMFRVRWTGFLFALPPLALTVLAAFLYYPPLQMALDWTRVSQGLLGKVEAFIVIVRNASNNPGGWLFGLGPGNSVSRVALMGMEGYIKGDSPVALLGLGAARTTREIWELTFSKWLFASSSVWSGISSWLGLLGDLGVAGLALYVWILWTLWRNLKGSRSWEISTAKSAMIMLGLLGAIYSWLEEPGFTLLIGLVVSLGLIASGKKGTRVENLSRPQFIPACRR
ncbi:MAG: hypothetical protein ACREP8_07485, partial [Candidatus Binatia bacterium]